MPLIFVDELQTTAIDHLQVAAAGAKNDQSGPP
jgi:hypothetical protein